MTNYTATNRLRVMGNAKQDEDDRVDRIVAQWQRERPDLPTQAMGILGRAGRTMLLLDEAVNQTFIRHGLQHGKFDVLAALRRSGDPFELKPSILADTLMMSRAGMTGRLDLLESAGLIQRIADPTDRRSLRIGLTPEGRQLVDVVIQEHVANEEHLLSGLSKADRTHLDRIFRQLLNGLERSRA